MNTDEQRNKCIHHQLLFRLWVLNCVDKQVLKTAVWTLYGEVIVEFMEDTERRSFINGTEEVKTSQGTRQKSKLRSERRVRTRPRPHAKEGKFWEQCNLWRPVWPQRQGLGHSVCTSETDNGCVVTRAELLRARRHEQSRVKV